MSVSRQAKQRGKILDEIMTHHRERLPKVMREIPLANLQAFTQVSPPPLDFYAALAQSGVSLIAECKKASPSRGLMVRHYDAAQLARAYVLGGARAISVLTDGRHFQGSLEDLRNVREAVNVPILRKDFIFDPYQLYEARAAGADAILLIAAVLGDNQIAELQSLAQQLGMNAVIEVHSEEELQRVLNLSPRIVGVNNRNLQTFEVDFANTARLRSMIPAEILTIGESGLKTADDVRQMRDIGVDAILVGETLVRSKHLPQTLEEFVAAGQP